MSGLHAGRMLTDNLRLERKLGAGAMGVVWVAENLSLGAEVAVKILSRGVEQPKARARFEQEARAAAKLDNPHLVRIYDYGVTPEEEPYIVMELLRGEDLRTHIEREGALSVELTALLIGQACRGVSKAHSQGVIHRDIKPANIFIIDNDGEPFVKLLDFGVAKRSGEDELGMTDTGAMMGTPYYMSPEQLLDPRRVDQRADLWSLGIVAYACLSGSLPFHGETLGALSVAIHAGRYVPLTEHRPELPAALDAWMAQALASAADDRFQSAQALSSALAEAASDATVADNDLAPPTSAASADAPKLAVAAPIDPRLDASTATSWMASPRRRVPPWIGLALAILLVGGVGWWIGTTTSEPNSSAQPPTSANTSPEPSPTAAPAALTTKAAASLPPADATAPPPSAPSATQRPAAPTPKLTTPQPAKSVSVPKPKTQPPTPDWDQPFYPANSARVGGK